MIFFVPVLLAEHAGFCFGVKRAIQMAQDAAAAKGVVYSLGSLIHNAREIQRLQSQNILPVADLAEIPAGGTVLIRTHGVSPEVFDRCRELGLEVVDATCPFVAKAQALAASLAEQGRPVIILGDAGHPEVEGLVGWSLGHAYVVNAPEDVVQLPSLQGAGLLAQTTQTKENWQEISGLLAEKYPDLILYNTICAATAERQKAVKDLAGQVDIMLVLGGKNSANTQKLWHICQLQGVSAYAIEGGDQLEPTLFAPAAKIGIAAGASTPDWIIEEVVGKMEEMEKVLQAEEAAENKAAETPAEDVAAQTAADSDISQPVEGAAPAAVAEAEAEAVETAAEEGIEPTFEEAYGKDIQDLKDIRRGARVTGKIVQIRDDEILVDIGGKSEGVVPSAELLPEEAANIRSAFTVGQEIEVLILKRENKEGYPVLSKRRVDQDLIWEKLADIKAGGASITGTVVEVVKGGILVDVGIRGFVPASLVDMNFVEDLNTYVGKKLTMKILDCEKSHNKLVLSPKAVFLEEARKKKAETWETLEEGQVKEGIVRRLTSFGAFVDIGGVDGLLHVSEMAWYRVNHPSDILKEGDEIKVIILGVDRENEKISLGLKQLVANPWSIASEKYPEGSIITAKVMRTAPFGAFVQVEPGVEGLVHISQLARHRVEKTEDVVKPGDEVQVKILSIDTENKRMSLSIRETLPEEPSAVPAAEEAKAEETKATESNAEVNFGDGEQGFTIGDVLGKNDAE